MNFETFIGRGEYLVSGIWPQLFRKLKGWEASTQLGPLEKAKSNH
jgi:hypothetical protein